MRSALLCASSAERIFLILGFRKVCGTCRGKAPPSANAAAPPLESPTGAFIATQTRIFQNCLFTGGVVTESSICSAAAGNEPSQAHCVRQLPRMGELLHLPVCVDKAPPFGGAGTPQGVTERVCSPAGAAAQMQSQCSFHFPQQKQHYGLPFLPLRGTIVESIIVSMGSWGTE